MKELTEEEKKNFLEWSEGNKYLYELLCSCWENGIMTYASCGGHENGNNSPYLGIIINNNSLPFIKSMLGQIQNMENIVVSSGVRGNGQLLAEEELRRLAFYAHNYNCCELFYKMRKGIETKERETMLSSKASSFYDLLTRLNATSREELQADVNDNIVVGSTFSTKTRPSTCSPCSPTSSPTSSGSSPTRPASCSSSSRTFPSKTTNLPSSSTSMPTRLPSTPRSTRSAALSTRSSAIATATRASSPTSSSRAAG